MRPRRPCSRGVPKIGSFSHSYSSPRDFFPRQLPWSPLHSIMFPRKASHHRKYPPASCRNSLSFFRSSWSNVMDCSGFASSLKPVSKLRHVRGRNLELRGFWKWEDRRRWLVCVCEGAILMKCSSVALKFGKVSRELCLFLSMVSSQVLIRNGFLSWYVHFRLG